MLIINRHVNTVLNKCKRQRYCRSFEWQVP